MTTRGYTVASSEISHATDKTAPVYSLEFEVYRSSTFLVVNDEKGNRVAHLDIEHDDWDALVRHTNRVRRADKVDS